MQVVLKNHYIVMFFNDESKIKIYSVIFYKLLYPQFGECVGSCKRPLASREGPEVSGNTPGISRYPRAYTPPNKPNL